VKRLELLLLGAREVFLDIAIFGVKEDLAIRRGHNFVERLGEESEIS
jgi:hypothetical protein